VLHTYPYKETSLIVELFARRFGRVALLARGARRPRSAMRGVLLSFQALRVSWSASAELGNLISAEWAGALLPLAGQSLMCGFYLTSCCCACFRATIRTRRCSTATGKPWPA
jgi:DNA repair protein RecO (recombination protein O)